MTKSLIDKLLDKEHPTKQDLETIRDFYKNKQNLNDHEKGYLYIAETLLIHEGKEISK